MVKCISIFVLVFSAVLALNLNSIAHNSAALLNYQDTAYPAQESTIIEAAPVEDTLLEVEEYAPIMFIPSDSIPYQYDTTLVGRKFNKENWKKLIKDLKYEEVLEEEKKQNFKFDPPKSDFSFTGLKYISTGIVILIVALLLFFLIKKMIEERNTTLPEENKINIQEIEDIEKVDESGIDYLLETSVNNKDYKSAVRILYILLVKKLHDTNLISWKKEKTNLQYLHEIPNIELKLTFKDLTLKYERIWFGDKPVSESEFLSLKTEFQSCNDSIEKPALNE